MKRIIPVLLIKEGGVVKSVKFKKPNYIGDPINAVKIFNEKEVDEIVILDIEASKKGEPPNFEAISEIASEAFMPLAYGGGIANIEEVKRILYSGVEKVILNTSAIEKPKLITEIADRFGSSSTVVSIDVKKNVFGKYRVFSHKLKRNIEKDIVQFARTMEEMGAGELFLNSVDKDGTFEGFDLNLVKLISDEVNIPVVACGGAENHQDFAKTIVEGGASAVAAGSMFVYQNTNRAVLINYPDWNEIQNTIRNYDSKNKHM